MVPPEAVFEISVEEKVWGQVEVQRISVGVYIDGEKKSEIHDHIITRRITISPIEKFHSRDLIMLELMLCSNFGSPCLLPLSLPSPFLFLFLRLYKFMHAYMPLEVRMKWFQLEEHIWLKCKSFKYWALNSVFHCSMRWHWTVSCHDNTKRT